MVCSSDHGDSGGFSSDYGIGDRTDDYRPGWYPRAAPACGYSYRGLNCGSSVRPRPRSRVAWIWSLSLWGLRISPGAAVPPPQAVVTDPAGAVPIPRQRFEPSVILDLAPVGLECRTDTIFATEMVGVSRDLPAGRPGTTTQGGGTLTAGTRTGAASSRPTTGGLDAERAAAKGRADQRGMLSPRICPHSPTEVARPQLSCIRWSMAL